MRYLVITTHGGCFRVEDNRAPFDDRVVLECRDRALADRIADSLNENPGEYTTYGR